jgi:ABC-type polysaccharide/polyol phosphate export permease
MKRSFNPFPHLSRKTIWKIIGTVILYAVAMIAIEIFVAIRNGFPLLSRQMIIAYVIIAIASACASGIGLCKAELNGRYHRFGSRGDGNRKR